MSLSARGRGRRGAGRGFRPAPMSRINVTPFVDVMLVLLIVFMIAAPLLSIGVPIDLPKSDESSSLPADQQILTVSVTEDGRIYLQDEEVLLEDLKQRLQARRTGSANAGSDKDDDSETIDILETKEVHSGSIYVRGDSQARYGLMAEIIAIVKAAGFRRIGFITETNPES
ncbi:MAG: ExbD/TolR family protein [Hyphomicrobiales bacterium]|nr:ExbD/TolR family protein [Hyphomicrobiales bacterium]MCY4048786.1 ExbD/TolR family protein [Hyphomicrobiales bacterium]MCY4052326.1 ExbD/TolR family protein [Hyphomicrobiales bacterium]